MLQLMIRRGMDAYQLLSAKDRRMLVMLVIFLAVVLFYVLLAAPLYDKTVSSRLIMEKNKEMLSLMRTNEARVSALRNMGSMQLGIGNKSLLSVVNEVSEQRNIALKRVEPKGDTAIRVWLEMVSFNDVLAWLHALETQFNISVDNITIEGQPEAGIVSAQIVLSV